MFETRYESDFGCPTKVLSQMALSEGNPLKLVQILMQVHDQQLNRADRYENELV